MKTIVTPIALIAFLLVGIGSVAAAPDTVAEKVSALIDTLEREKDAGLRKKAAEALVKLDKRSTPLVIEALKRTKSPSARESLVDVLAQKQDERAKKVFFEVLKDDSFSPTAKERAVDGLEQLTRVVNRASVDSLKPVSYTHLTLPSTR